MLLWFYGFLEWCLGRLIELEVDNIKFSVLMPVYYKDDPVFFEMALHSIFTDQTVKPSEIVIIVDGPVEIGLQLILDKWDASMDGLVTICQLPANVGLWNALQLGLKLCKHDLVARMDSDDISRRDRFEIQLSCFITNPTLDVCGSNIVEFVDDLEAVSGVRKLPVGSAEIAKFALHRNPINHPSVMFKRSRVIEVGGYLDMPCFEDYYLWVRCIMSGYLLHNVQENLVFMRAGKPQILRRSGLVYAKHEYKFLNHLLEIGFLKSSTFFPQVVVKFIFRLTPIFIVEKVYSALRE